MKRYIAKDFFGYSIWNVKPRWNKQTTMFETDKSPYNMDECCYVSDDLIAVMFPKEKIEFGDVFEFAVSI